MGILAMIWVLGNAQSDIATGTLTFTKKPLTTDMCEYNFSVPLRNSTNLPDSNNENDR